MPSSYYCFQLLVACAITILNFPLTTVNASPYCRSTCQFDLQGSKFDLKPLCDTSGIGIEFRANELGRTYQINVCGSLATGCSPTASVCTSEPDFLCALVHSPGRDAVGMPTMAIEHQWEIPCGATQQEQAAQHCEQCQILARNVEPSSTAVLESVGEVPGGIQLTFAPEPLTKAQQLHPVTSQCPSGPSLALQVKCECAAASPTPSIQLDSKNPCQYVVALASAQGCPVGYCTDPAGWAPTGDGQAEGPGDLDSPEDVGWGQFLFTALFFMLTGYLLMACWMHYRELGRFGIPDEHIQFMLTVGSGVKEVVQKGLSKVGGGRGERFTTLDEEVPMNSAGFNPNSTSGGSTSAGPPQTAADMRANTYDENSM